MSDLIAAVDYESYYDNDISVVTMGAWHYARKTDIYMVTVACSDGFEFVGHPKDCPWEKLQGATAIYANAGFDLTLQEWLTESGAIPEIKFKEVHDVLDMARYLGRPGSLAGAAQSLLGEEMSKSTRAAMKGKRWETMTDEFREEVKAYALKDARLTLRLWLEHGGKWPWFERELSRQTRDMCMRGVPVDVEKAEKYITHLKKLLWEAEQKIPWAGNDGAKILSPKALAEECRKAGIEPPKSMAKDSEDCAEWEEKYGGLYPWVAAMRDYRRCNILLTKIEAILRRTKPDGWMPFGLKYFGASTTGRWSGDSGVNLQNLTKKEIYGVSLRSLVKAPAGHKILAVDLSQIEPRCLAFCAGDTTLLEFIGKSDDLYDAQARAWGLHSGEKPLEAFPDKRHMVKGLNLGLGFGMSAAKFSKVAGVPAAEAERLTKLFRSKNPMLLKLWKRLELGMKRMAGRGNFTIELPSARELTYWDVSSVRDGLSAVTCRNGKMMRSRFWSGLLAENATQATAREVFAEKLLNIEAAGITLLFHVHDEAVCLVKEEDAERVAGEVVEIMSETPEWMPGLPLAAKAMISGHYTK